MNKMRIERKGKGLVPSKKELRSQLPSTRKDFQEKSVWHIRRGFDQSKTQLTAIISPPSPVINDLEKKKILTKEKRVLEHGAGKGRNSDYLKDRGYDVYAYDIYPQNKNVTDKRPQGKFDVILSINVLNTLIPEERKIVLEDLKKYSNKDTRIVVAVRGTKQLGEKEAKEWVNFQDGYITKQGTFQKFYYKGELERSLNQQGFKTEKVLSNSSTIQAIVVRKR